MTLFDVLQTCGLPEGLLHAIRLFYVDNAHRLSIEGTLFEAVTVQSGMRQGCPLSPLLFASCIDPLLRQLEAVLGNSNTCRAYADDTAIVRTGWRSSLAYVLDCFTNFATYSSMELNLKKGVFTLPSGKPLPCLVSAQWFVRSPPPHAALMEYSVPRKYLGFQIGPEGWQHTWAAPIKKYENVCHKWAGLHLSLFWNVRAYHTFAQPVLAFVGQLAEPPPVLDEVSRRCCFKLAPGPGSWCTISDLRQIDRRGILPMTFACPYQIALASKLRVCFDVGVSRARRIASMLRGAVLDGGTSVLGTFIEWHTRCMWVVLDNALTELGSHQISSDTVLPRLPSSLNPTTRCRQLQKAATRLIRAVLSPDHDAEFRVRHKLALLHPRFQDARLSRKLLARWLALRSKLMPCVMVAHWKSIWIGWFTDERVQHCCSRCLLCGNGLDDVRHYLLCPRFGTSCTLRTRWERASRLRFGRRSRSPVSWMTDSMRPHNFASSASSMPSRRSSTNFGTSNFQRLLPHLMTFIRCSLPSLALSTWAPFPALCSPGQAHHRGANICDLPIPMRVFAPR